MNVHVEQDGFDCAPFPTHEYWSVHQSEMGRSRLDGYSKCWKILQGDTERKGRVSRGEERKGCESLVVHVQNIQWRQRKVVPHTDSNLRYAPSVDNDERVDGIDPIMAFSCSPRVSVPKEEGKQFCVRNNHLRLNPWRHVWNANNLTGPGLNLHWTYPKVLVWQCLAQEFRWAGSNQDPNDLWMGKKIGNNGCQWIEFEKAEPYAPTKLG